MANNFRMHPSSQKSQKCILNMSDVSSLMERRQQGELTAGDSGLAEGQFQPHSQTGTESGGTHIFTHSTS